MIPVSPAIRREEFARLIAPHFARDAFDAHGGWLNNMNRCSALEAADAVMRRIKTHEGIATEHLKRALAALRQIETVIDDNRHVLQKDMVLRFIKQIVDFALLEPDGFEADSCAPLGDEEGTSALSSTKLGSQEQT